MTGLAHELVVRENIVDDGIGQHLAKDGLGCGLVLPQA